MLNFMTVDNVLNAIVPISRFNKGGAGKIFDEVKNGGFKIVVKNNVPTCVLITPEKYQELMEKVEDYNLLTVAVKRMENVKDSDFIASQEVMNEFQIEQSDLDDIEVEIE